MESQWNWLDDVVLLIVVGMIVSAWLARRCEGFEMLLAMLLSGERMVVDSLPMFSWKIQSVGCLRRQPQVPVTDQLLRSCWRWRFGLPGSERLIVLQRLSERDVDKSD